eukprot:Unigene11139_Nuclearia_a/m.34096 Unigene11139_Nuclearia_a/g.34096  ORF Unigene11139_Nuclearia_a/g.34096 Unigene11139_Nuclearia_a/m.34096 type:complete len:295 (+) Unigene11139_Nuclearia_a:35-919(+)
MGGAISSTAAQDAFWADRAVWITGASSGIGEALAHHLYLRGARLVLSARREDVLRRVRRECIERGARQHGGGVVRIDPAVLPLDLAETAALQSKAREAVRLLGRAVDVLVNNGGRGMRAPALDTTADVERALMDVNYFAPVELTRAVLPNMLRQRSGAIVVISSVQGRVPLPERTSYAASKHALHGYFGSLRTELRGTGVGVTLVLPGYVATNFSSAAATGDGSRYGVTDRTTAQGYPPALVAQRIADGVARGQREVWIMQLKARLAIWLQVTVPWLLEWALSAGIGHPRVKAA